MKDHIILRCAKIFLILVFTATYAIGQPGTEEDQTYIIRSIDEMLLDKERERGLIEKNLPRKAMVMPEKIRRLLIFDGNVNYAGHKSIVYANYAFTRIGEETGAFETIITRDTMVFRKENLENFDAVFFNNTVGNLFTDKKLRQNLHDFVKAGGGLMGVHGTSVAFTIWPEAIEDWPEFGMMLGARGAAHRENDEHVFIRVEDPDHPVNRVFRGKDFDYSDEFFRFQDIYSRDLVHVLLSIDTERTDMEQGHAYGDVIREDNDYALAWVRQYGKGRVFYSTIAHHPQVFWDPVMLEFYLDAIQYVLGDIKASAIPSNQSDN